MRRKSTRNSSKPQEKTKQPEQSSRKSRRTSKRHRKSTSSESEKSEEEQDTQVGVESEEATQSDTEVHNSKSEGSIEKETPPKERKMRRSNIRNSPREGDAKEDEEEETTLRRPRRRETPKQEDSEEDEGRTVKGKSKGKNKSKVEHQPTDASETFIESEICTNAQVTSQSPQTDTNNAVTCASLVTQCAADNVDANRVSEGNDENSVSVDDSDKGVDVVDSSTNQNIQTSSSNDETQKDIKDEVIPVKSEVENETLLRPSDDYDNSNTKEVGIEEEPESPKGNAGSDSKQNKEPLSVFASNASKSNQIQEVEGVNISEKEEHICQQTDEDETKIEDVTKEKTETEDKVSHMEVEKSATFKQEPIQNVIQEEDGVKGSEIENNSQSQQAIQEEPVKLRRPKDPKSRLLERKTSVQKIKINRRLSETKQEKCKRRWGGGLKLISPEIIDTSIVKNIYPNVQFLQESEVKLEYTESKTRRFSTVESSDEKSDRRTSIDFDRQTSEESTRNDREQDDKTNIIAVNRKISIIDDSATTLKPPPSPAKNPISEVLFITNLVRPFTLKQLRELLERTGKIKEDGFWTDRIKSKCYVRYETEEEAKGTREALHGVHWPIGNGKKLIIDYSTEEELLNAKNPPAPPPPPPPPVVEVSKSDKENEDLHRMKKEDRKSKEKEEKDLRRREHVREWDVGKEDLHRSKSKSNHEHERRRHSRRSPTPDAYLAKKKKKLEEQIPQKLMDDLFQKTKATPSIYWQPLTPEEIATKQQQRLERMAEHKKRLEETTRGSRAEYGRGAPYRRKYD